MASLPPAGQRDCSEVRITRHALERFAQRFSDLGRLDLLDSALRSVLRRVRRLGRNPSNGAVAVLGLHGETVLVAILQDGACVTVLTWNQFEPHLPDFGRARMPRKRGRMLARLKSAAPEHNPDESPAAPTQPDPPAPDRRSRLRADSHDC